MRYHQGKYTVKNLEKYAGDPSDVVYRSGWEKKFMIWCDFNKSVITWGSESFPIEYWSTVDNKIRRYFIDFFIKIKTKSGEIKTLAIEIKPYAQTQPPKTKNRKNKQRLTEEILTYQKNVDKWKAAKKWAEDHKIEFKIITEKELFKQ